MRHLYLTVQQQDLVPELFEDNVDAIRKPFKVLLAEDAIELLLEAGAATGESFRHHRHGRSRSRLPFIPGLGALRLNPKAQLEHRGVYHDYGNSFYPPSALRSSPTGLRLMPRTEEMVSRSHLSDTYDSEQNRALNRRISAEGAIDSFVSIDQSTWHIALSVEPRRRITVSPQHAEGARLAEGVKIASRAYVHIYPYGAMTVTVGISLIFHQERTASDAIDLIRALIGRRGAPEFTYEMRGLPACSIHDFVRQLNDKTVEAMVPGYSPPEARFSYPLDYAVSIRAEDDNVSDQELAGLVALEPQFKALKSEWVTARASLYGKYGGDRVSATRSSLAVVTSPRSFGSSGHRRFFWRCHAIKEFASLQAMTLAHITSSLQTVGLADGPDEWLTARLLATAEHLIELPRALPAHHRKWLYQCQSLVQGDKTQDRYLAALAEFHNRARHTAMIRRMTESPKITFNLTNSQIGTLNFGSIVGDVQSHLVALDDPATAELRDSLAALTQAIIDADDLSDSERREFLEAVDVLAEEANRPPADRRLSVVRSSLALLAAAIPTAEALVEIWDKVRPVVSGFFA